MSKKFLVVALAGILWGSLISVSQSEALIAHPNLPYFNNFLLEESAAAAEKYGGEKGAKAARILRKMKQNFVEFSFLIVH